ncbi:MAG: hypothetical protein JWP92_906 [Caulobacter sp.]|jgi:hypothetical protein|nr:hypothetical protein [Caulobacter sp.]
MSMTRFLIPAAALSLLAGAAAAQSTAPATPPADAMTPAASDQMTPATPPADSMAAPTAATGTAVPTSSMSPDQQATLKAGDANVVTNGPIADTPENRAKYGAPMSRAGKRTAPKGN